MLIRLVAGVVFAAAWSGFCTFLAKYELNKVFKKLSSGEDEVEDKTFDKKQLVAFGVITTVLNVLLAVALVCVYKETPVAEHIKRIGLIGLIGIAAVTDRKYNIIPNDLIKVGLIFRAVMLIWEIILFRMQVLSILISDGMGILVVAFIVISCLLLMKGSVGMGDLKLMMLMALCQGIDGFSASGMMSLIAAFFAAVYYLITRKKGRKDSMAFAPFLAVGTYLGVLLTGL